MKTDLKILVLFVLLGLVIFWPVFLGKVNLNGNLLVSFYGLYGENLPFKNSGWDALRIYFPFYQVTFEQLKQGVLPLWNPYAFSGHPHAADFQSAVFYPLNIFGLFLPLVDFWHLLRITPAILASFFTYLYLRNLRPFGKAQGQLSKVASFFGSLTFGFSPFILTWGEEVVMSPHSITWMPLIMFAIDRYLEVHHRRETGLHLRGVRSFHLGGEKSGSRPVFLVIIALSCAFSLLGGYMQTSIYMFVFIGIYLLLVTGLKRLLLAKNGWQLIAAFILGAGLSAVQLLPSGELFFNSARSQIALTEKLYDFLLPVESLLTYLAPDFFGSPATGNFFRLGSAQYYEGILFVGIAAVVFATFRVLYRQKNRFVWFLIVTLVVSLLTTLDSPISRWFLTLPIPFLSTSIPNRILFIPAFCLATLAAFGMDLWLRGKIKVWGTLSFYAFCYFLIILTLLIIKQFNLPYFEHAAFQSSQNVPVTLRNLIIPVCVFGASCAVIYFGEMLRRKYLAAVLIVMVAVMQIFYFSQKYFSFSDKEKIFPLNDELRFVQHTQNFERSWGVGQNFFPNNFASYYGIYWPGGYDSLNNRSYGEFSYAMQGGNLSDYSFRADAGLGQEDIDELLGGDNADSRRRALDMLGIRYVISRLENQTLMEANRFRFLEGDGRLGVFENLDAAPRAFLASNYEGPPPLADVTNMTDLEIAKERRKLIFDKLLDPAFDWRNVLILEKPSPVSPQFGEGEARIVSYKPNEVVVNSDAGEPKLLFLSDNYYPGWKAKVDGEDTEILRANYTFRAVPLTAGEHEVRFWYDPLSFKVGVIVSVLSLIGLGFLVKPKIKLI